MGPRPIGSRPTMQYGEESFQAALLSVQEGKMGLREAANFYGVPTSTLGDRLNGKVSRRKLQRTALSKEQEEKLVSWLEESARRGFDRNKKQILTAVQRFVKDTAMTTPFKDGKPGYRWFRNFIGRHKEKLSIRTQQALGSMRAAVTAEKIKDWFKEVYKEINAVDPDLLNQPERILNCDEICFQLSGVISRVVAPPKDKRLCQYQIKHDPQRQVTVLECGSATGEVHQPFLIFPGQRLSYDPLAGFPEAHFAKSESGLIDSEIFATWLQTAFVPAVAHLDKPVILFVNGHKSHLSLDVSELCRVHNIILYQLPSHSSQIVHPLDTFNFKSLKTAWREEVMNYQEEKGNTLEMRDFSHVLKKTWQRVLKKDVVISGFRVAGIYPWDPDHINLSKLGPSRLLDSPSSMVPTETQQIADDSYIVMTETQTPNDNLTSMTTKIKQNCDDIVTKDTAIIPLSPPNFSQSVIATRTTALPTLPPCYFTGQDKFTQTDTIDNPTASSSSSLDDNGLYPLVALDRLLDVAAKVGPDRLYEFKRLNTLKQRTDDSDEQIFSFLLDQLTKVLIERQNR